MRLCHCWSWIDDRLLFRECFYADVYRVPLLSSCTFPFLLTSFLETHLLLLVFLHLPFLSWWQANKTTTLISFEENQEKFKVTLSLRWRLFKKIEIRLSNCLLTIICCQLSGTRRFFESFSKFHRKFSKLAFQSWKFSNFGTRFWRLPKIFRRQAWCQSIIILNVFSTKCKNVINWNSWHTRVPSWEQFFLKSLLPWSREPEGYQKFLLTHRQTIKVN